jgi:LysR family transcriptional regulator for bpeEF and oprC
MDRLTAFAVFKTVVEHGSFTRTADALSMSPAVVTRHIQNLEELLGVRLLQRTTRRVALTQIGQDVLQRASDLLADYDALASMSSMIMSEATGKVRLAAPMFYAREYVGPALASYMACHPKVWVDLRLREGALDLHDGAIDLALCLSRDLRPTYVARQVAMLPMGMYASPSYVTRRGAPSRPVDLTSHDCLTSECLHTGASWRLRHEVAGELCSVPVKGSLHANHADVLVGAAAHGAGIVLLPHFMARDACRDGRLQRVLSGWEAEPLTIHLVYSSRRNMPLSVRKLIDHLMLALGEVPRDDRATARLHSGSAVAPLRPHLAALAA